MFLNDFLKEKCSIIEKICKDKVYNITGATIGEKTLLLSCIDKAVFLCDDLVTINSVKDGLESLGKKVGIITTFEENVMLVDFKDMSVTHSLIKNIYDFLLNKIDFLLILSGTILQKLPSKEKLLSYYKSFEVDKNYDYKQTIASLIKLGYARQDTIEQKGQFTVRGDIIDIFEIQNENILRISFFDDQVESIALVSNDFKTIKNFNKIDIYPADLFIGDYDSELLEKSVKEDVKNSNFNGEALLKSNKVLGECIEKIENNKLSSFFTCYLDFNENILSLFDDFLVIIDEPKKISDSLEFISSSALNNIIDMISRGELFKSHLNSFFKPYEAIEKCRQFSLIFQNIFAENNDIYYDEKIELKILGSQKYIFDFKLLEKDLKFLKNNNYTTILFCGNDTNKKIIEDFLTMTMLSYDDFDNTNFKNNLYVSTLSFPFSASFLSSKLVFIGLNDLFKKDKNITLKNSNKKGVFYLPKVGEYVVHAVHGIGRCIALERLKLSGNEKDYFIIEYNGGDKLYIPSEQASSISAFTGTDKEPKLNKLGGAEFAKIKERVKSSVKALAFDLVELYKQRQESKGFVYSSDNYLMNMFEEAFEHTETPDQLEAIKQIKADMESTKIMDRLICGDVGFGKTEVALRAIYKAVLDGKQVAFLCPTSILSQQHYQTCKKRFDGFMVRTEVLNRLKNKNQQEQIVDKLKLGEIDVICGTHRLLSNDVDFKNLGLLVLDEEQRFGVADKEKIKNLKKNIDVLSLSATPIPRTLHMSLSGIRDISIIETPPKERLPIQTYVTEFSMGLLLDACKRELARDGQVLIVFNNVEKIYAFAEQVRSMLPDINVGIAHGQMSERMLEDSINRLYSGEYRIMIATTLIENGVDLPMANTLFVLNSDRLGLSQLYQLRGRIGRSNRLAYAYFTYDGDKMLTEDAYKRLSAIMEYTELGSGFKIAMRDLEIRGAGNVLGKEQHGHMEKVGYDMYSKLLAEAVEEIKGNKVENLLPIKVDIDVPAFIDEKYIPDEAQRIKIYTEISELKSYDQLLELQEILSSSFGEIPPSVVNLTKIGLIKSLAQLIGVKRIILNDKICQLQLYKKDTIISQTTADAIDKNKNYCVLKFEEMPIINFDLSNMDINSKLDKLISFLLLASF